MDKNIRAEAHKDGKNTTTYSKTEHYTLSRKIASQGMVLLKNDGGILPLAPNRKVAVFGMNQLHYFKSGGGSGDVNVFYTVNLLQGMLNKKTEGKIADIYGPVAEAYRTAYNEGGRDEIRLDRSLLSGAASLADTAIISIGRFSEEGYDLKAEKGGYYLSDGEKDTVDKVCAAGFENIIVVLNIGNVPDSSWFKDNPKIKAVLIAWYAGMEGGNAIADVLCGDVNPSGKLCDTFAEKYTDYPTAATFGKSPNVVNYEEDIFVGYRYFETIPGAAGKVNYEFGFGLSFTTFRIDEAQIELSAQDGRVKISTAVTNTGIRPGKEVVQVYYSAPPGRLDKPAKALAAFAKTAELAAGEKQTLTMTFAVNDMASYDDTGATGYKSSYVLEKGEYKFYVGNSVRNAVENGTRLTLDQDVVTEQLTERLKPVLLPRRLKADGTFADLPIRDGTAVTAISAKGTSKLENESFSSASDKVCYERFANGKTGEYGRCASCFQYAGSWAEYQLDVEQAGIYNVALRAANGHDAAIHNLLSVYVDGEKQEGVAVDIPAAKGDWYTFVDLAPFSVALPKGRCTLRIVSNNDRGANLEHMLFTRTAEKAEAPIPAAGPAYFDSPAQATPPEGLNQTALPPEKRIMLKDVYDNPDLMSRFLHQLSITELINLSGGQPSIGLAGTGGIGNLMKYGIPNMMTADGPAGVHLDTERDVTAWPSGNLVACTWDVDLVRRMGGAIGREYFECDIDLWLAPGMNLHRDPLCGRNFEYFSEDPLVIGKIASAIIQGMHSQKIGVTIKHFAANNKEEHRHDADSRVTERAMRELYLKGFEIVVKETHPFAVMASYNPINGVKATENKDLLTGILRDEWRFDGFVMSDWDSKGVHSVEAAAGTAVKMPDGAPVFLYGALQSGAMPRAVLERNIADVLHVIMKSKAFYERYIAPCYIPVTASTKIKASRKTFDVEPHISVGVCEDTDGGKYPVHCEAGRWIIYNVDVEQAGNYQLSARISSHDGTGSFAVLIDDIIVSYFSAVSSTGEGQSWDTLAPHSVALPAGQHQLKILFTQSGLKLNWLQFDRAAADTKENRV